MIKASLRTFIFVFLSLCIAGALTYFLFANNNAYRLLQRYHLAPTEEPYTELYLNNHLDIPSFLEADKEATASFTINNREHKTNNYKFIVSQSTGDESRTIASGSTTLKQNQSKSFEFTYSVATTEPKTKVNIDLPLQQQSIHFYVNNK